MSNFHKSGDSTGSFTNSQTTSLNIPRSALELPKSTNQLELQELLASLITNANFVNDDGETCLGHQANPELLFESALTAPRT